MAVASVSLTFWSAAALSPAVQSTPIATLGSRVLAGQAVPPLGPAPGRQPQALRLSGVPFHWVDPRFQERPPRGLGE